MGKTCCEFVVCWRTSKKTSPLSCFIYLRITCKAHRAGNLWCVMQAAQIYVELTEFQNVREPPHSLKPQDDILNSRVSVSLQISIMRIHQSLMEWFSISNTWYIFPFKDGIVPLGIWCHNFRFFTLSIDQYYHEPLSVEYYGFQFFLYFRFIVH